MPDHDPERGLACAGCGRAYDGKRFPPGRTFRCTCGERVGRWLQTGLLEPGHDPRFLADVMLGKLARWLRALGYDCAWEPEIEDARLVRRGIEEHRIVLTRDRRMAADWWVEGIVRIQSDRPLEQLREVASVVPLGRQNLFTRCTHCNQALQPAAPVDVQHQVPADVRARQADFRTCPACRRVYWKGGHVERMQRALDGALGGSGAER